MSMIVGAHFMVYSQEQSDYLDLFFEQNKENFSRLITTKYPEGVPNPTKEDWETIEKEKEIQISANLKKFLSMIIKFKSPYSFPVVFKDKNKTLLKQIGINGLSAEWFPLCAIQGNEWFYIKLNKDPNKQEVARFVFSEQSSEQHDTYESLDQWLEQRFLTDYHTQIGR